jgi:hypothetical protein
MKTIGLAMLCNLFQEFPDEKQRVHNIYTRQGARSARYYVYRKFHLKTSAADLRAALGIPANPGALRAVAVHRLAWDVAGWRARGGVIRFGAVYAGDGNSSSGRGGGKRSLDRVLAADARRGNK